MSIGAKSARITIQYQVKTSDGQGGHTVTWANRCSLWAHERPLSQSESLRATQVSSVLSTVFEIWYRDDISVTDRISYNGRLINIEGFSNPGGKKQETHLVCSEVQA